MWMEWWLNSFEVSLKNIKLMTELKLSQLSIYLVEIWTVGLEIYSWKKSVISVSMLL